MLKVAVLVSGGGTNLQAIIDGIENGSITNAKIDVVISNNKNAYALERAKKHDIEAVALSPKDFETRDLFNEALYNTSGILRASVQARHRAAGHRCRESSCRPRRERRC